MAGGPDGDVEIAERLRERLGGERDDHRPTDRPRRRDRRRSPATDSSSPCASTPSSPPARAGTPFARRRPRAEARRAEPPARPGVRARRTPRAEVLAAAVRPGPRTGPAERRRRRPARSPRPSTRCSCCACCSTAATLDEPSRLAGLPLSAGGGHVVNATLGRAVLRHASRRGRRPRRPAAGRRDGRPARRRASATCCSPSSSPACSTPGEYAGVVTFLALFVLLHVPSAALSAAGALSPERLEQLDRAESPSTAWRPGRRSSPPADRSATATGLDRPLRHRPRPRRPGRRRCSGSPAASPTATSGSPGSAPASSSSRRSASPPASPWRWLIGPLGAASGPSCPATPPSRCARGAADAHAGRDVPRRAARSERGRRRRVASCCSPSCSRSDLLVANRVLDADEAARFAVLSTIGGAAFFATATIPLVLLPAVRRGRPARGADRRTP